MKKPLFSALYILSLMTAGLTIHKAFAGRGPSVEPMTEVSIEEGRPNKPQAGFDFAANPHTETKRVPANITAKTPEQSTPYSYIGPMIFLLALPIALWIVVAKKMKNSESPEKVGYYPKTYQFKPYTSGTPKNDMEEDEDQDYPKAS